MKIISLSSSTAGEACAIFSSIKKYFYDNNCITDFFSYLVVSMESINQLLILDNNYFESYFNTNYYIYLNTDKNYTIEFNNFDKMISHHDLYNLHQNDIDNVITKYKRRYDRFMDDIENENKIFFIRYGIENIDYIKYFIEKIKQKNNKVEIYFINLYYFEDDIIEDEYKKIKLENYTNINFYTYIETTKKYNNEIFYRIMEYDWKPIYYYIRQNLSREERELFHFYQ